MTDLAEITSVTGPRIEEAVYKLLVPLQTARVVSWQAFEDLMVVLNVFAKQVKGSDAVPKSLLQEIYSTFRVLRNESPYFKEQASVLEKMADQLEMLFGLILINETPEDRKPGVPRIH